MFHCMPFIHSTHRKMGGSTWRRALARRRCVVRPATASRLLVFIAANPRKNALSEHKGYFPTNGRSDGERSSWCNDVFFLGGGWYCVSQYADILCLMSRKDQKPIETVVSR